MIPIDVLMKVYANIFTHSPLPQGWVARSFKGGTVPGADGPNGVRLVAQNTATGSHYAALAKQGSRIAWLMKGPQYIGKILNGVPDASLRSNSL